MDDNRLAATAAGAKLSLPDIRVGKGRRRMVMVIAYDYPSARLSEAAGIDLLLVGNSLGMVVLGYDSIVPVTIDTMIHHGAAVVRGAPHTHVVVELPFGSYEVSDARAVESAVRVMKETGCDAVKLEGGAMMAPRIAAITRAGIPVMAHISLTPRPLARTGASGSREGIAMPPGLFWRMPPPWLRQPHRVSCSKRSSPTGRPHHRARASSDDWYRCRRGVRWADALERRSARPLRPLLPRYVKRHTDLGAQYRAAIAQYAAEVREGSFPAVEHTFAMKPEVLRELTTLEARQG
jgi:3-methyl-2-oxobutanoate hydroxymethyltransferase